jgi:hypothetical protein
MSRFRTLLLAALVAATPAVAGEPSALAFQGEQYGVANSDACEDHSFIEFVRQGYTIESWKKLLAVHRYMDTTSSPQEAAHAVAKSLKEIDPRTQYSIIENNEGTEAVIDYLAIVPGANALEFNVFKCARHPSGQGLYAFQFAQRFEVGDLGPTEFKRLRDNAVTAATRFELSKVASFISN